MRTVRTGKGITMRYTIEWSETDCRQFRMVLTTEQLAHMTGVSADALRRDPEASHLDLNLEDTLASAEKYYTLPLASPAVKAAEEIGESFEREVHVFRVEP